MKIDRTNIENVYNRAVTDAADKRTAPEAMSPKLSAEENSGKDKVQISDKAREYAAGKTLANAAVREALQETRPERLMKLKSEIAGGNYNVPSGKIADAILGKHKYE